MIPRGLIGVVHLLPLPGDPRYEGGGFEKIEARAMADVEELIRGGADAALVENFGSAPFSKGTGAERIPPHQAAALALIVKAVANRGIPVGVNCLRNDALTALGIASVTGASFIRVNVLTGAYVTDQGVIEGEADRVLRYRDQVGARHVAVLADVLVKHAEPLAPLALESAVHDTFDRGLADGVIVTGAATGAPVSRELLSKVRAAAGERPVFIGSGLTDDNAAELMPFADGGIVGTWLKRDGRVSNPVDAHRVRFMAAAMKREAG